MEPQPRRYLPKNIIEKFSTRAKSVVERSMQLVLSEKGDVQIPPPEVEPRHLLAAVASEKGGLGANILRAHHLENSEPANQETTVPELPRTPALNVPLSTGVRSVIKKAVFAASAFRHRYVGTEHLLYGLTLLALKAERRSRKYKEPLPLPENFSTNAAILKRHIEEVLFSMNRFPDLANFFELADEPLARFLAMQRGIGHDTQREEAMESGPERPSRTLPARSHLANFTDDLTAKAERNELDPLVGRGREIDRLVNILSRRAKNNPILIGDPGVGKTAIVQGLASRIVQGGVPENLLQKRILALDLSAVVAGTVFRGEFEARLKEILREAKAKRIIIFIDEIHTVVGAGSAAGSLDAANILKPALSQGIIQCIGATTLSEYRKYIEKDAALERRFQPILVRELTVEESLEVLRGVKAAYEKHHNLSISDEAMQAAALLAERYLQDRFLPDKAIDVIDEAAAYVRGKVAPGDLAPQMKTLEKQREDILTEKERAIEREEYEKALKLKKSEEEILKELSLLQNSQRKEEEKYRLTLSEEDIRRTIAHMTGIPLEKLQDREARELKDLEKLLARRIIGQDDVIRQIAKTLRRARAGLADPKRPLGSFIFLGPTGVGKTELAKALAEEAYHDREALIKFDMSEFMEPHSVSKFIGAPPGYVGYEEEGKLVEQVRRRPHSIILFDEIEKAHPQVFNILLQVLEEGELTSSAGRKVNFKNTVIIMTSNIGTDEFTNTAAALGFSPDAAGENEQPSEPLESRFEEIRERALKELRELMRPELLNRIDAIIVFRPLSQRAVEDIARLELNYLAERLKVQKKLTVTFAKNVATLIAREAFNPRQGARPVRRAIESLVEDPLAEKVIASALREGDALQVEARSGKITISKTRSAKDQPTS